MHLMNATATQTSWKDIADAPQQQKSVYQLLNVRYNLNIHGFKQIQLKVISEGSEGGQVPFRHDRITDLGLEKSQTQNMISLM